MAEIKNDTIDPIIVERLRNGDEKAFNVIYETYFQRLYFFAQRFVGEADAKDITADVFSRFWEKRAQFEQSSVVQHYLFVSVRNKCLNLLERERVRMAHQVNLLYQLETMDESELDTQHLTATLVQHIYQEVEKLPARQREIFQLSFRDGLKPAQIAELLDISVQTVHNQKLSALRLLRDVLQQRAVWVQLMMFLLSENGH